MFIKLTEACNSENEAVYVNISQINYMYAGSGEEGKFTFIDFADGYVRTKETPEEIMQKIKLAQQEK